jgi:hypothetical protein
MIYRNLSESDDKVYRMQDLSSDDSVNNIPLKLLHFYIRHIQEGSEVLLNDLWHLFLLKINKPIFKFSYCFKNQIF